MMENESSLSEHLFAHALWCVVSLSVDTLDNAIVCCRCEVCWSSEARIEEQSEQ